MVHEKRMDIHVLLKYSETENEEKNLYAING
jgi:hypothetical protein